MNIHEAAKKSNKIRRSEWGEGEYIDLKSDNTLYAHEILKEDWELFTSQNLEMEMELINSSDISNEQLEMVSHFTEALKALTKTNAKLASPLMSIPSMCEYLNITESKMRSLIFNKKIPFIKVGREIRFEKEVIESWIESNSIK